MKKIQLGDIFEIETSKGLAYLQYVWQDKLTGEMIKVWGQFYASRLTDFQEMVSDKERFIISFPVAAGMRKGIIKRVGNLPIVGFVKPSFMRTKHSIRGEFLGWHIVDTETLQRSLVVSLNSSQIQLSPWGIWNDTLLIEKLESGWTLDNWT